MAQRRMFNKAITNNDNFLEMPDSSQNLYFHLSMNADDDGFVDNWKSIMKMTGHKEDDLKILISKQYVIPFESGVIVIKHWKLNNYLQNDRKKPTIYQEELLSLNSDNNNVYNLDTTCIHSIGKYSIEENSIEKKKINKKKKNAFGKYERVMLTDDEYEKLCSDFGKELIDKQIVLLDEYLEINNNKNKYTNYNLVLRKSIRENWFKNSEKKENKDTFTTKGEKFI